MYNESFAAIAEKITAKGSAWFYAQEQILGATCAKSINISSKNPNFLNP